MPVKITRRTVLQKVRGSSRMDVPQFVNTRFQVLFYSPPGVLFTFPSQYYALSVTEEYLALEGENPVGEIEERLAGSRVPRDTGNLVGSRRDTLQG